MKPPGAQRLTPPSATVVLCLATCSEAALLELYCPGQEGAGFLSLWGCDYFSSSGFVLHCTDFGESEQGSDGSLTWLEEEPKVIHSTPTALL